MAKETAVEELEEKPEEELEENSEIESPKSSKRKAARDLAFELFYTGKRPSDPEVKSLKIKSKTCYNYFQKWKKEAGIEPANPQPKKGSNGGSPDGKKVVGKPVEVGKITITPENWGMSQYGAIVILDSYDKAKTDIGYTGTIGDFICDVFKFYRRCMNYMEVQYARTTGEGERSSGQDGETCDVEVEQFASAE